MCGLKLYVNWRRYPVAYRTRSQTVAKIADHTIKTDVIWAQAYRAYDMI